MLFMAAVTSTNAAKKTAPPVTDRECQVKISDIHNISGFIGDRIRLNREVYLKDFPIERYVDFIVSREHTSWDWTQAEQHGKWIESACLSALQSGDSELMDKVHSELCRIIASQEPSGYLGATAADYRSSERPVRGMDPYELYFVFHAFITVYEETGDVKALESVKALADYFLTNFGPGKNEFWPSDLRYPDNVGKELAGHSDFAGHSVHYSWEGTLLCDPIARLYQITGEKKYLEWAQWAVSNIDRWSGWNAFSRLDDVASGDIGVNELQPYVHSHTFHMNFMGFLRLYSATGDKSYLKKVAGAWDDINRRQMYITGGVSVAEHYEGGFIKPLSGNIVETCATMSWMQLTQMLLLLTGDVKYADAIERIMLNHVFAAQDEDSGICRYHTPPTGDKPAGYYHGPDCCTGSGHRIISLLPTFFYAKKGSEFFINQYVNSSYGDDTFGFTVSGRYPAEGDISVIIDKAPKTEQTLMLRIPSWCTSPSVSVNGLAADAVSPASYLAIRRKFKSGDRIDISFPMEGRWIVRENHSDYEFCRLPGGEMMYRETEASRTPVAFMRGPVVYCVDMIYNAGLCNDDMDIDNDLLINTAGIPTPSESVDESLLAPAFKTGAHYLGAPVTVVLTPFANIGRWHRDDSFIPDRHSAAFTYSIWLYGE